MYECDYFTKTKRNMLLFMKKATQKGLIFHEGGLVVSLMKKYFWTLSLRWVKFIVR